jgi:hypothetical protein
VIYEAKAKDTLGNPGTSGSNSLVGPSDVTGPTVTITTSPANPTTSQPVTFTATATDPSGIQSIEIWVAGAKVSECTSSPCTYTGGPYLKGTVSYEAKAKDTVGNPGTSGSKSLPVVQAVGNISVTSNPSGASILLDGAMSYGTTPFGVAKVLTNVIAGQHTLKLSKDHYKYMQANITVTAGQTTYINWSLTPAPDTQLVIQPGPSAAKECTVRILNQATQTAYPGQLQIGGGNSAAGDEVDRGFLRFDLSSIPATAHITEANIGLCYSFTYYYTSFHLPAPIGLYKVTGNWDRSTITWGNQPASEGSAVSTTTVPGSEDDSFYYWPATALVQGWLNGSIPNYGIVLKDTDESTYEGVKIFASTVWDPNYYNKQITSTQYPKLVITYWDPTP